MREPCRLERHQPVLAAVLAGASRVPAMAEKPGPGSKEDAELDEEEEELAARAPEAKTKSWVGALH